MEMLHSLDVRLGGLYHAYAAIGCHRFALLVMDQGGGQVSDSYNPPSRAVKLAPSDYFSTVVMFWWSRSPMPPAFHHIPPHGLSDRRRSSSKPPRPPALSIRIYRER